MLDIVETEGIETVSFLDILPNPTVDMVNAATKVYKESGATSIVALGGGSPMDVAKAVGVLWQDTADPLQSMKVHILFRDRSNQSLQFRQQPVREVK